MSRRRDNRVSPPMLRRDRRQPPRRGVAISQPLRPREAIKLPRGFEAAANLGNGADEPAALLHMPQRLAAGAHAGKLEAGVSHGAILTRPAAGRIGLVEAVLLFQIAALHQVHWMHRVRGDPEGMGLFTG